MLMYVCAYVRLCLCAYGCRYVLMYDCAYVRMDVGMCLCTTVLMCVWM